MAFTILDDLDINSPWEMSVRVATTANITLSGTQTIDTIAVAAGELVLVKNQTTASQNGLYVCAAGAWTRYFGGNADGDFAVGQIVYVREGNLNGKSVWTLATVGAITVGTTSLAYNRIGRAGQATAGTFGSATQVPVAVLNDDGTVSSFTNTSIAIGATQVTGLTNTQILFGNVTGQIGQSSNLIFSSNQLGVGGNPAAPIHAVGGYVRADGVYYTRGAGSITASNSASGFRVHNTTVGNFWYLSHDDDGNLRTRNDSGTQVFAQEFFGGAIFGSGTPDASAILAAESTTKGFLPPRMTTTQRDAIVTPTTGLILYNTTTNALTVRLASSWLELGSGGGLSGTGTANQASYFTGASTIASSADFGMDPATKIFSVGSPASGTARIVVKGATTNNTAYQWQGFNSTNTETSRISNDGYFQGYGLGIVGLSTATDFAVAATLDQTFTLTHTTGTRAAYGMKLGFAPTSGTGVFYGIQATPTINQTGGANGITAAGVFGATLTAAADFRGVWITNTAQKALWQDSTGAINLLAGDTGMGTQTNPQYILDIGDTGAIRLPVGTTAQQPTAAIGLLRLNSSNPSLEYHDGVAWRTMLTTAVAPVGLGAGNNQIAYFSTPGNITSNANGGFDGTNMGLGVASTANQRLTIVGAGNTSGTYGLVIHNSGGSNNQFVVRNDGRVGILTAAPIVPLHVEGAVVFGTAGANTTNSPRTFNLYDANAVVRVWRKTNTTNAGPAVELVWGPVFGGSDTATAAANRYWDFFVSGQADQFGIRKRTGGTDQNALFIEPTHEILLGPYTKTTISGPSLHFAAGQVSTAGDSQATFLTLYASSTATAYDLFLNGSSTYPDLDTAGSTNRTWAVKILLCTQVTARTTGTPVVGDSNTMLIHGFIKKVGGTYASSTFTTLNTATDGSLNTLSVAVANNTGALTITVTRPAGTATYRSVASVELVEIGS